MEAPNDDMCGRASDAQSTRLHLSPEIEREQEMCGARTLQAKVWPLLMPGIVDRSDLDH